MNSIHEGEERDEALKKIESLDCGNQDKTLASCDPAAAPPPEVLNWQKKLLEANVDGVAFQKALAKEVEDLVCANETNAIYILHGVMAWRILTLPTLYARVGREAPALVDFIMSKACLVSAALTNDDKAKLLQIKQDAEKKFAPPPASKNEK